MSHWVSRSSASTRRTSSRDSTTGRCLGFKARTMFTGEEQDRRQRLVLGGCRNVQTHGEVCQIWYRHNVSCGALRSTGR